MAERVYGGFDPRAEIAAATATGAGETVLAPHRGPREDRTIYRPAAGEGVTMGVGVGAEQATVLGGFERMLKDASPWVVGGFDLPDGTRWDYREPGAMVLVQRGRLRVTVARLSRQHDRVQVLDNAKHMYFSRERVPLLAGGATVFDITMRAQGYGTAPNDLYDGFVSLNLLDFETGTAVDFFVSNDRIATVFARLPFPGVLEPRTGETRYFGIFDELSVVTAPGQPHDYRIVYDHAADEIRWYIDGEAVNCQPHVPDKLTGFTVALGLMTEKDISPSGSTSLHGQGLMGEWSPITVSHAPAARAGQTE